MKKIKLLLALGLLGFTGEVFARSVIPVYGSSCSVEIISDICGDGQVNITFSGGEFTLNHGDVHCWFGPFKLKGSVENPRADHTGTATKVDLVSGLLPEQQELVGELVYRQGVEGKSSLATLRLTSGVITNKGGKLGVYYLKCEDFNRFRCEEYCLNEGNKYFPTCHGRCGGW